MSPAVFSALSGVALALCLPKPGLCALGWIGLAPLIYCLDRCTLRQSFKLGWLGGAGFNAVAFYWIYPTCRYADVPVVIGLLAWAALASFQGLAWGFFAWIGKRITEGQRPSWRPLLWAVVWTGVFAALERWTPRLPGDLLAYTQWRHLTMIQVGALAGPHALGFVIAFVNAALAGAWEEPRPRAPLASALALAGLVWLYGAYSFARRPGPGPSARVEILQPSIDQYKKWKEDFVPVIMGEFAELWNRPRAAAPALVVWPEAALPVYVEAGTAPTPPADWGRRLGAMQLVGAVSLSPQGKHNSVVLIDSSGTARGLYHKRELVPFGEYVPMAKIMRRFVGRLNELGGITAGDPVQPLFDTPWGRTAASICYEAVFPRWARRDAARGARLIVNVTNDGWYKATWGPRQHFKTNVYRAVENRVTVIRSGNTGISAVIDPWGVETAMLDLNARGRLDAEVPLEDPFPRRSPYTRTGDWLGLGCLALTALILAVRLSARPVLG